MAYRVLLLLCEWGVWKLHTEAVLHKHRVCAMRIGAVSVSNRYWWNRYGLMLDPFLKSLIFNQVTGEFDTPSGSFTCTL